MRTTHRTVTSFAVAVLLVMIGILAAFWSFRQIEEAAAARRHTFEILSSADDLLSELKDAETGQRGYLLTGDDAFLEPYMAVRDSVSGHLEQLRSTISDTAAQKLLDALVPLVEAKWTEMAQVIELRRNQELAAAIEVVRGSQGKHLMDAIRAEMRSMITIEQDLLARRETEFQSSMHRMLAIIIAVSVMAMMLAFAFAYLQYRESKQRLRNLTHRETQRMLETLKEHHVELENAKSVAENANRAKSDFLSSMSHELRTPLNAILGFAQLLESGTQPPTTDQRQNLDHILKAGWHLLALVDEILDLALIESGKMRVSLEPVSLAEVMLECRAMVEPQAQMRGIKLSLSGFETSYYVSADRTRLKQVVLNLLSNAIKYNRFEGAVAVECHLIPMDSIRVIVRDTGGGLTREQVAQLFQPFDRLGQEFSTVAGTGIGLVVTKRLIELMGHYRRREHRRRGQCVLD